MEPSQAEYENLQVLVTANIIGTKKSLALDKDEKYVMTFNSYDIEYAIGNLDFVEHYKETEANALKMGDALVSYTLSDGQDFVSEIIRDVARNNIAGSISPLDKSAEDNLHTAHEILPHIFDAIPSFLNLDPADAFDIIFSRIASLNILEQEK